MSIPFALQSSPILRPPFSSILLTFSYRYPAVWFVGFAGSSCVVFSGSCACSCSCSCACACVCACGVSFDEWVLVVFTTSLNISLNLVSSIFVYFLEPLLLTLASRFELPFSFI